MENVEASPRINDFEALRRVVQHNNSDLILTVRKPVEIQPEDALKLEKRLASVANARRVAATSLRDVLLN